jgi:hypothetical protein
MFRASYENDLRGPLYTVFPNPFHSRSGDRAGGVPAVAVDGYEGDIHDGRVRSNSVKAQRPRQQARTTTG